MAGGEGEKQTALWDDRDSTSAAPASRIFPTTTRARQKRMPSLPLHRQKENFLENLSRTYVFTSWRAKAVGNAHMPPRGKGRDNPI